MLAKLCRRLPLPRTLRWQFTLALSVPALLIVAGGLTAVYGWRISSDTARQLSEQRLAHLQQAQHLVHHAFLIERKSNRMLTADAIDPMQTSYLEILEQLDLMDALVRQLGQSSNNLAVLALNQANQLFRNWEYYNPSLDKRFDVTDRIISWPDGRDVKLQPAIDITDRKRLEDQLRRKNKVVELIQAFWLTAAKLPKE
jgi:phosphoglycerate-specific signal transduction histidine kinase